MDTMPDCCNRGALRCNPCLACINVSDLPLSCRDIADQGRLVSSAGLQHPACEQPVSVSQSAHLDRTQQSLPTFSAASASLLGLSATC